MQLFNTELSTLILNVKNNTKFLFLVITIFATSDMVNRSFHLKVLKLKDTEFQVFG